MLLRNVETTADEIMMDTTRHSLRSVDPGDIASSYIFISTACEKSISHSLVSLFRSAILRQSHNSDLRLFILHYRKEAQVLALLPIERNYKNSSLEAPIDRTLRASRNLIRIPPELGPKYYS